jgi:CTP synthase
MNECEIDVEYIHSEDITEKNVTDRLSGFNGILVAPGFGSRGIEGKILTARYARENNIPFFGICLGMQCAVIEFARNILNLEGAHSTEINHKTKYPVIDLMEEQKSIIDKGGTMRLGGYKCVIDKNSKAFESYQKTEIIERHRHRYEFNNKYYDDFKKHGMVPVGINPESGLVEIIEIPDHKWFIGVQFHPEYSSTVINPHPLFVSFVKACIG